MKSTGLKGIFLALTCLATTAIFAQDTSNKPKPDTTMRPRRDTTSMNMIQKNTRANHEAFNVALLNNAEILVVAKNEMENEVSAKKSVNLVS
jgi:adenylate kinase